MLRLLVVTALLAAGCRPRATPEQQVRALISRAAEAAEDKDLKALGRMLSDHFAAEELDRPGVLRLLQLQFLRYPEIHVLLRVPSVELPQPGQARVTLLAALASLPLHSPEDLARSSADLYRFELSLVEETKGDWRLQSATWSPVHPDTFF